MKKNLLLFFICFCFATYGQENLVENKVSEDKWDKHSLPNTNNYFYHHFKKYITENDLISTDVFPKDESKIILEFNLDKIYNIINLRTNTKNTFLEAKIIKAFQEIDFEQVHINKASELHNYSMQIIAKEHGKAVLKCSSIVLHEVPPIMYSCEKKLNYVESNYCLISNLEYYIEASFDTIKAKEYNLGKSIQVYCKLSIRRDGKLDIVSIKSEDSIFTEETKAAIKKLNLRFKPATLNDSIDSYTFSLNLNSHRVGTKHLSSYIKNASIENELAIHFKKNIPSALIQKANLNLKNNNIFLTYSYNKKGQIENVNTNAKDIFLENAIIKAFKTFPESKLTVPSKKTLYNYITNVVFYGNEGYIIKCNAPVVYEIFPIFYGCEKSKTNLELNKCNQTSLQRHVKSNFDSGLSRGLKPGIKRIFVLFSIDTDGNISDIRAKAPSPVLKNEAIRVVKKFKVKTPGKQFEKTVRTKYSLPIAFKVEEKNNRKTKFEKMKNRNPYKN